ncbi:MAG: FAD-dependent oxidoreductase [Spirochaetota bacterium]|jgi:alkyl hydroperoxide reductase subunit F|nr:FAD-dependent oxidoreductase [Spirochaetota bacterium]OPZ36286.1 MAG: NADH dehydrogenase [Spirochaetes bacterium ADurb.BinA120]
MEFKLNIGAPDTEDRVLRMDAGVLYDVIIVGGGPAALTAAVYCMRKGVSTGLITMDFGGQLSDTSTVENYMGYSYITGVDLANKFKEQVRQFEIAIADGKKAVAIEDGTEKVVRLDDGSAFRARSLIITTGKSSRKLGVPGEIELTGRGVAYCAICDAPLFAGKRVVVVGGGNSGIESAIDLAKIAEHVTVVQFLPELTADRVLVDAFEAFTNTTTLYEHEVMEIVGTQTVESVKIRNRVTGDVSTHEVQGIFIEIGLDPNTVSVKGLLKLNEFGEIEVDCACRTNRPGIFAAGDVTSVPFKQIIIAAGEGAKAALSACEYILRES